MSEQQRDGGTPVPDGTGARAGRWPARALPIRRVLELLLLAAIVAFPLLSQDLFTIDRVARYFLYAVSYTHLTLLTKA